MEIEDFRCSFVRTIHLKFSYWSFIFTPIFYPFAFGFSPEQSMMVILPKNQMEKEIVLPR